MSIIRLDGDENSNCKVVTAKVQGTWVLPHSGVGGRGRGRLHSHSVVSTQFFCLELRYISSREWLLTVIMWVSSSAISAAKVHCS